jgi:hypothetical protein
MLVHSQFIHHKRRLFEDSRGFRAWWAPRGPEFVLCNCGWCPELPRPASHQADLAGLGEHQADSTEMLPNDNAAVGDAIEG